MIFFGLCYKELEGGIRVLVNSLEGRVNRWRGKKELIKGGRDTVCISSVLGFYILK